MHISNNEDGPARATAGPLPPQLSGRPGPGQYDEGVPNSAGAESGQWETETDSADGKSYRSSPEPYCSDMDEEYEDPHVEDSLTGRVRVRRGSEGYEIAPKRRWDEELDLRDDDLPPLPA